MGADVYFSIEAFASVILLPWLQLRAVTISETSETSLHAILHP